MQYAGQLLKTDRFLNYANDSHEAVLTEEVEAVPIAVLLEAGLGRRTQGNDSRVLQAAVVPHLLELNGSLKVLLERVYLVSVHYRHVQV